MADSVVECGFLIPLIRDANLGDGEPHSVVAWDWLTDELWVRFGGATWPSGTFEGFYRDPDTGARVSDKSNKFIVAISEGQIAELRQLLTEACEVFCQKCIYLSIAGQVEFIEHPRLT